jgi:poly-gamma-glutamate synthesis protein (capsule biosynthesis protein)
MDAKHTRRELLRQGGRLSAALAIGSSATLLAACGAGRSTSAVAPTATESVSPTASPDMRPVTIGITGDVMLGRSVNQRILQTSDRYPFNNVADALSAFDVTVGNLECVVSRLGRPEPKQYTFEADPRGFARLTAAGYSIMSVANNHSGDYGKTAFMDMLAHLPQHGITPLGGGANRTAAHQPVIRTVRSTTLGFLAYCQIEPNNFAATATTPGHAWLDPALMTADIRALRPRVDFLIVFTHWGIEYHLIESSEQTAMARVAIDAGADFVVGAHPHVIQPSSTYRGKPIVFSLGNFVFDEMPTEDVRRGNVLALEVQGSKLLHWSLRTSRLGADWAPSWVG